jgi:diguanylate cyclase (GGDEF)-like protein
MALVIIDVLGWAFNCLPGSLNRSLNITFNLLMYISIPIAPSLWIVYSDYRVNRNVTRLRRLSSILLLFIGVNALLSLLSLEYGWYFLVDAQNVYSRGPLFVVYEVYCIALVFYSFVFILMSRKQLGNLHFLSLIQFFVPQAIGIMLQWLFYGTSYNWAGMTISLLIIYFYIQNHDLNTDYLTGVYNRRELDGYIRMKIKSSAEGKSFSAILLDMNEFKQINDQFGHEVGDAALRDTVEIIKKNLRPNDFLARYGGDEFMVVLALDERTSLMMVMRRIRASVDAFNALQRRPYQISFSMGGDVYDPASGMTPSEFFSHIDKLMYEEKNSRI